MCSRAETQEYDKVSNVTFNNKRQEGVQSHDCQCSEGSWQIRDKKGYFVNMKMQGTYNLKI